MSTLSSDSRLRNKVAAVPGTVILMGAGHVDRVIRFTTIPTCLENFKTKIEGGTVFPVLLNLDRGPDQEAWNQARREAFLSARRDKPMPDPLPVSEKTSEGWAVDNEDVPVIEYEIKPIESKQENFICDTCTTAFNTAHALKIHQGRTKHT